MGIGQIYKVHLIKPCSFSAECNFWKEIFLKVVSAALKYDPMKKTYYVCDSPPLQSGILLQNNVCDQCRGVLITSLTLISEVIRD